MLSDTIHSRYVDSLRDDTREMSDACCLLFNSLCTLDNLSRLRYSSCIFPTAIVISVVPSDWLISLVHVAVRYLCRHRPAQVMSTYERRYTYCEHNMHASIFLFLQVS